MKALDRLAGVIAGPPSQGGAEAVANLLVLLEGVLARRGLIYDEGARRGYRCSRASRGLRRRLEERLAVTLRMFVALVHRVINLIIVGIV